MVLHKIDLSEQDVETLRMASVAVPIRRSAVGAWWIEIGDDEGKELLSALLETNIHISHEAHTGRRHQETDLALSRYHRRLRRLLVNILGQRDWVPRTLCVELDAIASHPVSGGSFGDVFMGLLDGGYVAVKALRLFEPDSEDDRRRKSTKLLKEMLMWRPLAHQNILPLLGITCFGERLAMVSPWMPNGNIVAFVRDHYHPVERLLLGIARGLEYLHGLDLIHGDLRGANILVDSQPQPRLADFGLTVIFSTSVPAGSSNAGLSRWAAPEALGITDTLPSLTPASDVYAFAYVCIEVYTLRVPFPELNSDYAVLHRVMQGKRPPRPRHQDAGRQWMSLRVWQLVEQCWAHLPEARPSTEALVMELENLQGSSTLFLDGNILASQPPLMRARMPDAVAPSHLPLFSDFSDIDEGMLSAMAMNDAPLVPFDYPMSSGQALFSSTEPECSSLQLCPSTPELGPSGPEDSPPTLHDDALLATPNQPTNPWHEPLIHLEPDRSQLLASPGFETTRLTSELQGSGEMAAMQRKLERRDREIHRLREALARSGQAIPPNSPDR